MNVGLYHYLLLSAMIFSIGTLGVLVRRNAIVIFMSIELMLNAVNISFVAASKYLHGLDGQIFVFFIMAVAAAEAAVGLAIVITFFRQKESIDVEDVNLMKW